ncbi:MAG TPA: hypothetical protein VFY39_11810 [Gammaproteobacteria bacterium]|nr:hypothetical protein [Gammaproteobacteria bacterium]
MREGLIVTKNGVRVIQGMPSEPLQRPTLFLHLWRYAPPGEKPKTLAMLRMARPTRDGYVIKELIPETEEAPSAALEKAVAIARRGDVAEIYVNADLTQLPRPLPIAEAG